MKEINITREDGAEELAAVLIEIITDIRRPAGMPVDVYLAESEIADIGNFRKAGEFMHGLIVAMTDAALAAAMGGEDEDGRVHGVATLRKPPHH